MKFYKDLTTNKWILGTIEGYPAGKCLLDKDPNSNKISIIRESDGKVLHTGDVKDFIYLNSSDVLVNYDTYANFATATSDFFVKPAGGIESGQEVIDALGFTPADEADLNTLQGQVDSVASGFLGAIAYNATAPTPAKSGYYVFSNAGTCSWLSGSPTVKNGDKAWIQFTSPITYVRTYENVDNTNTDFYNVSVRVPLTAGSYYIPSTARNAVPSAYRKRGLTITYEMSNGLWVKEQFANSDLSMWVDNDSWTSLSTDILSINSVNNENIKSISVGGNLTYTEKHSILTTRTIPTDFTSKFGTFSTTIWFNYNMMNLAKDSVIKRIYGRFTAGEASIYILNSLQDTVRIAGTFNAIDGVNDVTVNIPILEGESITIDRFCASNGTNKVKSFNLSGYSVTPSFNVGFEMAYQIEYEYTTVDVLGIGILEMQAQSSNIKSAIEGGDIITTEDVLQNTTGDILTDFTGIFSIGSNIYFNKNLSFNQDSIVDRIYGNFIGSVYPNIYILNPLKNSVRVLSGLINVNEGVNDISVNIPVYAGEMIAIANVHHRGTSMAFTDKYDLSGTSVSNRQDTNVEFALQIGYKYINTDTVNSLVENQNKITKIETEVRGKNKYVKLHDNLSEWLLNGFSLTDGKLVSTTAGNYCYLPNKYSSDKRYIRIDATIGANSIIKIPVSRDNINSGSGVSCFGIDLQNKKIIIYAINGGDTSEGYSNTELYTTVLTDDAIVGTDYIIEIKKDNTSSIMSLFNKTSGVRTDVACPNWTCGRQLYMYYIQNISGSIIINASSVWGLFRPDIIFTGDSITEGVLLANKDKRYAQQFRANNPNLNVIISAVGGDNIDGVLSKFDTEFNFMLPTSLMVTIGTNGGNSVDKLTQLIAKCEAIGCELYLNHVVCKSADYHILVNQQIDQMNQKGVKLDVSTALEYFPTVDATHLSPRINTSIYADGGVHPDDAGNDKMYQRIRVDAPELFS